MFKKTKQAVEFWTRLLKALPNTKPDWEKTSRQLGTELIELQRKYQRAEQKIARLEIALLELRQAETSPLVVNQGNQKC